MILPFGKHKGLDISNDEVPIGYLKWCEEQDWTTPSFRDELNFEIKKRESNRPGQGRILPFKGDKKK